MRKLIIAIDGPVGSGKSTVARRVAQMLEYIYIDTGRDVSRGGAQGSTPGDSARCQ